MEDLETNMAKLSTDPGAPVFAEIALELVAKSETRAKGREICLRGLAADPDNLKGRLALAKSYYLDSMPEFCVRELIEIKARKNFPSLQRLIDAFGAVGRQFDKGGSEGGEDSVIGEVDFEADLADVLEDLDE